MGNTNFPNSRIYSGHYALTLVDFNFTVSIGAQSGLGISNLKGAFVEAIYMRSTASIVGNTHTNTVVDVIVGGTANLSVGEVVSGSGITAGTTIASITSASAITLSAATASTLTATPIGLVAAGSPNPAAGYMVVKLSDNYNGLLFYGMQDNSPLSGTNLGFIEGENSGTSGLTIGQDYVITVLGTTTTAAWVALGVPIGVTPALGVSFIAIATNSGLGTGKVQLNLATGSGIVKYDILGVPNKSIAPIGPNYSTASIGSWFYFRCLAATSSSVTTLVATAPADGTVIYGQVYLSNTSLQLGGQ